MNDFNLIDQRGEEEADADLLRESVIERITAEMTVPKAQAIFETAMENPACLLLPAIATIAVSRGIEKVKATAIFHGLTSSVLIQAIEAEADSLIASGEYEPDGEILMEQA